MLATIDRESINPNNFTKHKYKEAAIIVGLANQSQLDDDIEIAIKYGVDFMEHYPRIVPIILMAIEDQLFPIHISKQFLQKIYDRLPKSQWEYLNQIVKLINKKLATKTSKLNKKNKWNKLGLPSGAGLLWSE